MPLYRLRIVLRYSTKATVFAFAKTRQCAWPGVWQCDAIATYKNCICFYQGQTKRLLTPRPTPHLTKQVVANHHHKSFELLGIPIYIGGGVGCPNPSLPLSSSHCPSKCTMGRPSLLLGLVNTFQTSRGTLIHAPLWVFCTNVVAAHHNLKGGWFVVSTLAANLKFWLDLFLDLMVTRLEVSLLVGVMCFVAVNPLWQKSCHNIYILQQNLRLLG